jgi:hypothetical protein
VIVRISSINQVSCGFNDGTVRIDHDADGKPAEVTLVFASDELRYAFLSDVAIAGQWSHQRERERMELDMGAA